jgi:hypothetical protein
MEVSEPDDPLLAELDHCGAIPVLQIPFLEFNIGRPAKESLKKLIHSGAAALIESAGEPVPETREDRLAKVSEILTRRRSRTFPVHGFDRRTMGGWAEPEAEKWERLEDYIGERKNIDAETQQLTTLFVETLKLPVLAQAGQEIDCPLCGTEGALTPERVASRAR